MSVSSGSIATTMTSNTLEVLPETSMVRQEHSPSRHTMKLKRRWIERSNKDGCNKRIRKTIVTQKPETSEVEQATPILSGFQMPLTQFPLIGLPTIHPAMTCQLTQSAAPMSPPSPRCFAVSANHLHYDPRTWSKQDVQSWLKQMALTHNLDIDSSRFSMNGKGLCMMSMAMFIYRVPTGGKLLYKDFRIKLYQAVHLEEMVERRLALMARQHLQLSK